MAASKVKTWRIIDVLNWSKGYLQEKGVESPQIEVEWMLREVLGLSRIEVYLNFERPLSKKERAEFKKLLLERAKGKPIQYVLGYTEFMGLKFKVSPHVLIPRQETEIIVEKVLDIIDKNKWENPEILDVGTGSGNIATSIALLRKGSKVTGIDKSEKALKVAKENANLNSVSDRTKFIKLDILKEEPEFENKFDVVVSNPPYVAGEWFEKLPEIVKKYEPIEALNPGEEEVIFYKRLSELSNKLLSREGVLIVEIGGTYQEAEAKGALLKGGLTALEVIKDYNNQSRGIIARAK
jgi:release factor glutamine methyltransferase